MAKNMRWTAGLMAFLLAGCASVQVVNDLHGQQLTAAEAETVAHLNGDIYGYYLFGVWPLMTGDPDRTNRCAFFRDTVTIPAAVEMVTRKSRELGATRLTDLTSRADSTGLQTLFTVWYYSVQVSGNAVK